MKTRDMRHGTWLVAGALALALAGCGGSKESAENTKSTETKAATGFTVTDVEGRVVHFDKVPERIILGESRHLFATSILNKKDPLNKVVAWGNDMQRNVQDYWTRAVAEVPAIKEMPVIGSIRKGDVTVETLVAYNPDVVVLSSDERSTAEKGGILDAMDAAGIKYVVTDFRHKPLQNTTKSMEILGKIFDREKEAAEFNSVWQQTVDMIESRTKNLADKPVTFVWRAAGLKDCCSTWNNSNISELVNNAGGINLGDEFLPGEAGDLTPEQVIKSDPKFIIATGGDWGGKKNSAGKPAAYAAAGYGIDNETAQGTMQVTIGSQAGFELLSAPKQGHFYTIWHQFYNAPFNYLAMLQIAAWLHPEEFKDIDVHQEWMNAHERWSLISGEGAIFSQIEN